MKAKIILTASATIAALAAAAPAPPSVRAAYSSFTTQSTATSFHDPATSGGEVAITVLDGYYMGYPIYDAHVEIASQGIVSRRGDPGPSGTFTSFGPSRISTGNSVASGAGVSGDFNDDGVVDAADYVHWRSGETLRNDPTPGLQPEDYDTWRSNFGREGAVSATTIVAFPASYGEPTQSGIFTKRGGKLTTIAKLGDPVSAMSSTIAGLGDNIALSGSTVAFTAAVAGGMRGVFAGSGGELTTIAKSGDVTSAGPLAFFSDPTISGNTVAFAATVESSAAKGIFAGNGGELTTIFKTGDPAPIGVFDSFDAAISMGTGGKVAFRATYDSGTKAGIFTGAGGELITVVEVGDEVPGFGTITSLSAPSMSGNKVAFYATSTGGDGFFLRNGTEPVQLIANKLHLFPYYDPLRYGPHGINMGRFGFSGDRLAFRFYVGVHAGNSIGIIGLSHSPEPATAAMLGLAMLALIGCTRSRCACGVTKPVRPSSTRAATITHRLVSALLCSGLLFGMAAIPAHAQTLEWVRTFGTAKYEWSNGVSADGLGNVYTASYRYTDQPGSCPYPYTCFDPNAAVTKFDAAGNLLWTQLFGSSVDDVAWAVSADGLGNVFLAGDKGADVFLAKYDPAGNQTWTRQLGTPKADYGRGVSADGLGNVYISGRTEGMLAGNNAYGTFLSKYDADGNQQWIRQLSGFTDPNNPGGVSADELGNVFLMGNHFIAKFDASGTLQWTHQFGSGSYFDTIIGVSADGLGNVYVAGSDITADDFVRKFDTEGNLEWSQFIFRGEYDYARVQGLSADGRGNVYATGYDLISKLDEFGNIHWTHSFASPENLYGEAISADGLGNIYIAGFSIPRYDRNEFVAKFVEDPTQQPPVVLDSFGAAYQGELVVLPFLIPQGTTPITYHDLTVAGPYDAVPVNAPMVSSTGELLWQTTTSDVLGWYYFDVSATNAFGSDKGRITLRLQIPEPATIAMLSLAILAVGGFARRRNSASVTKTAPADSKRSGSIACRRPARASFACVLSPCVAVLTVLVISPCAQAALIRQSAWLGSTGQTVPIISIQGNPPQYLGWRFSVANVVNVESVGSHLRGTPGGSTFFAAIVSLSGPTALPSGNPFDMTTIATTVFTPPFPSDDILVPLSVNLQPGDYALIFGTGQFGAGGQGGMPFNNTAISGHSSFITWGSSEPQWRELSAQVYPLRFVLAGTVLPEPGTWLLAAGACAGILCVGLRRRSLNRTAMLAVPLWIGTGLLAAPAVGGTITVTVPGTSNPWLAGMPAGSTAIIYDVAPAQSPVKVTGTFAQPTLTFVASGLVNNGGCGLPYCPTNGPDGGETPERPYFPHDNGAENGISDARIRLNALVGVFLDSSQPNLTPAPGPLDFSTPASRDYLSVSPGLKQVFFIGDGFTSTGETQRVLIPAGATRLFLGTMDGCCNSDNSGSFTVHVTGIIPEPATWLLAAVASAFLVLCRKRSRVTLISAFAAIVFTATAPVQAETLDGHTVTTRITTDYPHGLPSPSVLNHSVVGPGTEIVEDVFFFLDIDLSDTNILITSRRPGGYDTTILLISFTDTYGTIPRFTDVTINPATNWTDFRPSQVWFEPNSIHLDLSTWEKTGFEGEQISLDITAIIPEPATWVIAAVATAFLTFRTRQQRRMLLISAVLVIVVLDPMPSTQASTISTFPAFAARTEDRIRNSIYTIGQTFTVTPGTESLSSFTFYLRLDPSRTEPYPFRLWELDDNGDFQSLIFSGLTTSTPFIEPPRPGGSTDFIQVTMQTGTLPLTPSRSYLAALIADSLDMREWGDVGDLYPDGGSYHFKTRDSVLSKSNIDLAFTAEFVGGEDRIYGTIPEPATRAMLGLALLAGGGCVRRRISCGVTQPPSTSPRSPRLNSTIVLRASP